MVAALLIQPIVVLGWGEKFAQVAVVLWWLLPGIVMWSATRIIAYDFSARGRPELNSYLAGVVLVINVALNVILIPRIGMIGGAISTTVAYTANTFATVVSVPAGSTTCRRGSCSSCSARTWGCFGRPISAAMAKRESVQVVASRVRAGSDTLVLLEVCCIAA